MLGAAARRSVPHVRALATKLSLSTVSGAGKSVMPGVAGGVMGRRSLSSVSAGAACARGSGVSARRALRRSMSSLALLRGARSGLSTSSLVAGLGLGIAVAAAATHEEADAATTSTPTMNVEEMMRQLEANPGGAVLPGMGGPDLTLGGAGPDAGEGETRNRERERLVMQQMEKEEEERQQFLAAQQAAMEEQQQKAQQGQEGGAEGKRPLEINPGKYEDIMSVGSQVLMMEVFDGARFELAHSPVTTREKQFAFTHSIWMGSPQLPGGAQYEFGSNLVLDGGKVLMISRMDAAGRVNGRYHQQVSDSVLARLMFQIAPEPNMSNWSLELDQHGKDYCAQLKLGFNEIASVTYSQGITPNFAVGTELLHHGMAGQTLLSFVTRLGNPAGKDELVVMGNSMGRYMATYARHVAENVIFVNSLSYNQSDNDSVWQGGCMYVMRQSMFRGLVDSQGRVSASLEEMMAPGFKFQVVGSVNHSKDEYQFGFGLSIGQ